MKPLFHYAPVAEAIAAFELQGFTPNFNIEQYSLNAAGQTFIKEEFDVVDFYPYEGDGILPMKQRPYRKNRIKRFALYRLWI